MTESEVADFDREEAEDLIDFAEGLDYDKYINDLEIRQALCVMRDRVAELGERAVKSWSGSARAPDLPVATFFFLGRVW